MYRYLNDILLILCPVEEHGAHMLLAQFLTHLFPHTPKGFDQFLFLRNIDLTICP